MATVPERVAAYVAAGGTSWGAADVTSALVAEQASQARACRVVDPMPDDLVEALCRRVARNLSMRSLPLGFQTSMTDGAVATTRVGGLDAEIRRFEAPYRRSPVG